VLIIEMLQADGLELLVDFFTPAAAFKREE